MKLFNKKLKDNNLEKENKNLQDYTNWEKDLGFLNLILNRKKGITKEFLIGIYDKQKKDKDYLTDEELEPIISRVVNEVSVQIGEPYKNFLIKKYFGTESNLIIFITEDVYVDLVSDAINRNIKKISSTLQKNVLAAVSNLNKPKNN